MKAIKDKFGRVHDYARISLIDRCNLNCIYCNPPGAENTSGRNKYLLTSGEISRLAGILVTKLGVRKIRLTGGEPLIRKDFPEILRGFKSLKDRVNFKLGITTNGTGLGRNLMLLKESGVDLLNISLDTLKPERFSKITGRNLFFGTMNSIMKALEFDFERVKINTVIMKGINDDELTDFIRFFRDTNVNIRFIEYMPFRDNGWNDNAFMSSNEMSDKISSHFTLVKSESEGKIAEDFKIKDIKCTVSFISPVSNHFCGSCNRLRITSDGRIKSCLFAGNSGKSLKDMLSETNIPDEEICVYIEESIVDKNYVHPEINELITLSKNNMLSIGG